MKKTKKTKIAKLAKKDLTRAQKKLSNFLFEVGAVKFGSFRLKLHETHPKAPLSPIYIDLRMLRRIPEVKRAAVEVYKELVSPLKFHLLADIPTAATPLVSSLSDKLKIGMITPRADAKSHGSGAKIDGLLVSDKKKTAVLIDDLVTRADSKIEAANTLKAQGIKVTDIVVLIDREQGGRQQLKKSGYKLHSAFTMPQMLEYYLKTGKLTKTQYDDIRERINLLNQFLAK